MTIMAIRNNAPYNKTGIRLVPTLTTFYETQSYLQQVPNLNKFSLHVPPRLEVGISGTSSIQTILGAPLCYDRPRKNGAENWRVLKANELRTRFVEQIQYNYVGSVVHRVG